MANCYLCRKKVGFFDTRGYLIEGKENTILCDACTMNHYRLVGSLPATEKMKEDATIYFEKIIMDETVDEGKKEILKVNIEAFEIEREKRIAEEAMQEAMKKREEEIKAEIEEEIVEEGLIYNLIGVRGRRMRVYENKVVINVDVGIGSLLTGNATDGEKTIYYKDCVGVQFKESGLAIGYLQLETAGAIMNNKQSNFFNENSFTFDTTVQSNEKMREVADYVKARVEETKNDTGKTVVQGLSVADEILKFKGLLDMGIITQEEFDAKKKQLLGL